mgnify:CR=1 FL=1
MSDVVSNGRIHTRRPFGPLCNLGKLLAVPLTWLKKPSLYHSHCNVAYCEYRELSSCLHCVTLAMIDEEEPPVSQGMSKSVTSTSNPKD